MVWWMCSLYDTCFCIHWNLCLASSIGPWVICLYCVSDTNKDTIPLVSSCTCRWPRRAAKQASCCFSSNRLPCSPLPFPSLLWVPLHSCFLCDQPGSCKASRRAPISEGMLLQASFHVPLSLLTTSAFCSAAKWLLCRRWIHYILEIFHPGSPGSPQHCSCYSPAYHRLQHVPGKPSLSLLPSVCVLHQHTFSLFICLSLLFSLPCSTLLLLLMYTIVALSITVTDLCVWYLQNVKAMQPLARMSENRHVLSNSRIWCTQMPTGKRRHWPHDHGNHRHDDLVEDVEEVTHYLPPFAHPTHADSKGDEEAYQAFETQTYSTTVVDAKQQTSGQFTLRWGDWTTQSNHCDISSVINSPSTFMPHLYSSFFLFTKTGSVWFSAAIGTFFSTVWT